VQVNAGFDAGYAKLTFSPMFFNGAADIEPQNYEIHHSSFDILRLESLPKYSLRI
jgi:hypothetical protein